MVSGERVLLVLRSRQQVEAALVDYHNELNHLDVNKCLRLLNERWDGIFIVTDRSTLSCRSLQFYHFKKSEYNVINPFCTILILYDLSLNLI